MKKNSEKKKNITINIPADLYEAIIQQRDEAGYQWTSPFLSDFIGGILGAKYFITKEDMLWFKYAYFIRTMIAGLLGSYAKTHGKDKSYYVLMSMGVAFNKLYSYSIDDELYPITPELSAKLNDIAECICDWVYNLKLDECNLKVNKLRDKLNIEKLLED